MTDATPINIDDAQAQADADLILNSFKIVLDVLIHDVAICRQNGHGREEIMSVTALNALSAKFPEAHQYVRGVYASFANQAAAAKSAA